MDPDDRPTAPDPRAGLATPCSAGTRLRPLAERLRSLIRRSEVAIVLLAAGLGILVGFAAWAMGWVATAMHEALFRLPPGQPLSDAAGLDPLLLLLVPAAGGFALGLLNRAIARRHPRPPVDPIEANALHGGRMTVADAAVVGAQTVLSNGVGASVGLEAAYTQVGGAIGSRLGLAAALRRADLRVLVGAGAAGAIGAAFDAPLTGAFYGFELVIGTYSIAALYPVAACAVVAVLTARALRAVPMEAPPAMPEGLDASAYPPALLLGLLLGLLAIGLMRGVSAAETLFRGLFPDAMLRLTVGGLAVGGLAHVATVALSAGHGALHHAFATETPALLLAMLLVVKVSASVVSLGAGFRGGLFFASLLMGALAGQLFAALGALVAPPGPDPLLMALAGMGAFAAAVIGAPLAMAFLALETTGSLSATGVVLAAVAVAGLTVRKLFGYNFATWRFHLRGETIRSAHDVGWIEELTVGRMMRREVRTVPAGMSVDEFRRVVPLGSAATVVAVDAEERYLGLISVPEAHAAAAAEGVVALAPLLGHRARVLTAGMNAREAMTAFEAEAAETLAVVDGPDSRRVIGLLEESRLLRRYGQELERRRREEAGLG
jgi:chloride channel protein, CIC family